jgi:hypothetical protein
VTSSAAGSWLLSQPPPGVGNVSYQHVHGGDVIFDLLKGGQHRVPVGGDELLPYQLLQPVQLIFRRTLVCLHKRLSLRLGT